MSAPFTNTGRCRIIQCDASFFRARGRCGHRQTGDGLINWPINVRGGKEGEWESGRERNGGIDVARRKGTSGMSQTYAIQNYIMNWELENTSY